MLYTCCLRIDSLLTARVEHLGEDQGHHVIKVKVKGGAWKNKPVPPIAWAALQDYLGGRADGWLFCTASGGQLDEPAVWRLLNSLARLAGLTPAARTVSRVTPLPTPWRRRTPGPTRSSAGPTTTTPAPPSATTAARNSSTTAPATPSVPTSPATLAHDKS